MFERKVFPGNLMYFTLRCYGFGGEVHFYPVPGSTNYHTELAVRGLTEAYGAVRSCTGSEGVVQSRIEPYWGSVLDLKNLRFYVPSFLTGTLSLISLPDLLGFASQCTQYWDVKPNITNDFTPWCFGSGRKVNFYRNMFIPFSETINLALFVPVCRL